ncbi:alpha-mannosidase, partial [Genlisea aurea]
VYNTSGRIVPGKINVHLVPHTHDDVGWLKTIDQYYVGLNNSIQGACVQNVLDSVIPALLADRNRRFIYVEQAFFQRWWRDQSEETKSIVKGLVYSGRLEFINGGICMHDEATTHYIDMIDQTTLGHRFLKDEFGVTPRIGWQIDPFGHSAVQAYLLGAEVGFDALFFGRIDYQDRAKRKGDKTLEVVWRGSKSRGSLSQIFAGAFYAGNYEPPDGFYFEVNDDSPIVQDNVNLFDFNVHQRVEDFVAAALFQANVTRSNHIMWTMGTDFKYQYAQSWFRNIDKLINYVNLDGRVNALYSTPSFYADAKHALNEAWPLKTDDFFPYADRINAYWTGYFTSRPAIKGYVRLLSGYFLAARQLEFFVGRSVTGKTTDSLASAIAISQHHDAVTGTEQQHVAYDYATRLSIGYEECPLLNISYCPATEADLSNGKRLAVLVYNSLGWKRTGIVRIPVTNQNIEVRDSAGYLIPSQVLPIADAILSIRNLYARKLRSGAAAYSLSFEATVPPLGFNTYYISLSFASKGKITYKFDGSEQDDIVVGPGNLKLVYSGKDGKLTRYINSKSKVDISLEQSYIYYAGFNVTANDTQASGAYIFRPNGTYPLEPENDKFPLTVLRGPLFDEVHQKLDSWVYQITKVYKDKDYVEVEYAVGPIPIDDKVGKEIVSKIKTDIGSNKTFYTDSNGRDFLERIRNYRADWTLDVNQPVAGNYYPINLGIYIQDEKTELSVLVDRSVGGSSIFDGEVEIMLHRRLLHDDGRGVGEALNETVCFDNKCFGLTVVGKYYLQVDPVGEGSKWRRSFGQKIYSPFLLTFTELESKNFPVSTFSGLDSSYSLPENVAIITLQELENGAVLLRFAHLYEEGEDKDLSTKTTVDLKKVFPTKKINKMRETSLSANQDRAEMEKKRLIWKVEGGSNSKPDIIYSTRGGPVDPKSLIVELAPMEIRTFVIEFSTNIV